jgi:hypothetical protein
MCQLGTPKIAMTSEFLKTGLYAGFFVTVTKKNYTSLNRRVTPGPLQLCALEHFTVKLVQLGQSGIMRQSKKSKASTAIQHERKPL